MVDAVYQLQSSDPSPVTLAEAKSFLRITSAAEDTLIQSTIDACTEWGESYTRRSFRAQVWHLLLDSFYYRTEIRRQIVDAITSITHLVAGSPVAVASTVYYLKQTPQGADILLASGQDWPTNTDEQEQAITVNFTTAAWTQHANLIHEALLKHIAAMYANRGDCMDGNCTASDFAKSSGAAALYDMFAIARV